MSGDFHKMCRELVSNAIVSRSCAICARPYEQLVVEIRCHNALHTDKCIGQHLAAAIRTRKMLVPLTLSQRANVSAGNGCMTSQADDMPSSDPVLHRDGSIIRKQSSRGKRRNKPLTSALSSIELIGPGLIRWPRRRWYNLLRDFCSFGGKANSSEDSTVSFSASAEIERLV